MKKVFVFLFIFLILFIISISPEHVQAVTGELIINSTTGIITSPIYYDAANSAYYLDPAGTNSLIVAGNVGIGTTVPTKELELHGNRGWNSNTFGTLIKNDWGPAAIQIDAGTKTDAGVPGATRTAAIDFKSGGTLRWGMGIHPNDNTNTGFKIWESQAGDAIRFMIDAGGNVGIGTTGPGYKLDVQGGSVYASGSSRDFKKNISNLEIDSSKIYDLQPVSYDYKDQYKGMGFNLAGGRQFGLIAEDTYKIIPELVISHQDKKTANIDYQKLSVLLLDQMQKQKKEIDSLKSEVSSLKNEINAIKQTLKTIGK